MVFGDHPPSKDEADLFAHHLGSRCVSSLVEHAGPCSQSYLLPSVRYQPDDHFAFSVNHLGRKKIPQDALSAIHQPILVMTGTGDVRSLRFSESHIARLSLFLQIYIDEVGWYKEHLSGSDVSTFVVEGQCRSASHAERVT